MKAFTKTIAVVILISFSLASLAQRKITGIVYNNGAPAAGIHVEAHRINETFFTGFDGKYEITVTDRSKWVRFSYLDKSQRVNIEQITSDEFNFSWDGSPIPETGEEPGAIYKTIEELQRERDSEFLNNYSLYREFLKQDDIKSALPYWRKVYRYYPKSTTTIYIDGLRLMETQMNQAMMTDTKEAYLDSMMQIFDKRIKYFNNAGELLGRKAAKYLEVVLTLDLNEIESIEAIKKGYGFAEQSIKESGNKTEPTVLVLFMQSARRLYTSHEFNQSTVLENYEKVMAILDAQMQNGEMKEKAAQALPLIEQIIENSGALDCDAMAKLYEPKFKDNPNDIEQIKKMLRMFRRYNCDNELIVNLSEKLFQLEPSAEAAFNMARMFLKKDDNVRAFEYYERAYTKETNSDLKATYYYEASALALQKAMLQRSRDLAKEAIKLKSDYCEAYMVIGEVYVQASRDYSTDDFERSTVFWLATDYFRKAASYETCRTDGNNKARNFESYFPSKDDTFFRSLEEGQNYNIGGWINETTKVRVK
jgi:tetratricopeptide (TPR) repeat protein